MPLANCVDCGKPVSTSAAACPHCGAPPPPVSAPPAVTPATQKAEMKHAHRNAALIFGGLLVLGILISAFTGKPPSATEPATAAARTYGDVSAEGEAACRRRYPDAPEMYCKRIGLGSALDQRCKDKPWTCDGSGGR